MPSRKIPLAFALLVASLSPIVASAASPDAWAAFRRDVEASCRAAAAALIEAPIVTVDPFGSASYGLAVLSGRALDDGLQSSLVCVYDKTTHQSEIGGAMALQRAGERVAAGAGEAATPAAPAASDAPVAAVATAPELEPPATPSEAVSPAASAPEAAPTPAEATPPAPVPATAPAPAADARAEAALAERFASFPSDPDETDAAPGAAADPAASPQNQRVVTPPVPILPNVPGPAPEAEGETREDLLPGAGEGAGPDAARAPDTASADAAATPEAPPTGQAASPAFAGCATDCAATLAALSATDQKSLTDLPFEIDRTIARNASADLAAGPGAARAAAGEIAANLTGGPSPSIAAPTAALEGERSCVLYYFGYSNQAARSVGRHRCAVSAGEGGGLVVEKISGERLRAELKPLTSGVAAFVGRTYRTGQADNRYDPAKPVSDSDKDLGNSVGLATASEGRLLLTSSELRRFEGEDNFFWVLAIDPKE